MRSFHAAAETGSLTAAGRQIGVSQSAVSRHIATLESELGLSLFQRHARGLVLTDAGHVLHRATSEMKHTAHAAYAALHDQQAAVQGTLIVTAPLAFGAAWLIPRLSRFSAEYDGLNLDIRLDDGESYDLLKLEAECALRLWPSDQVDLIQRKLARIATSLYAAPAYLETFGTPQSPQDLDSHRIIAYRNNASRLKKINFAQYIGRGESERPRSASLIVNNISATLQAAIAGIGITTLPDYMVGHEANLVRVLPDYPGPSFDLYFVYPSDLRGSGRIAAFRDFLTREIAQLRTALNAKE